GLPRPERSLPAGLTPREAEVLIHLARGATNKEIAASLGIAVRTANHHIENIYAKLDVTTRAAAAVFAVRHDLVAAE
ncbi:MAG TPA: helix-turn-helix transcriptional regulator, partial [Kofleriaceae bacterium]|nr:helix-turn-helix transcriptional regulator [Kofleriaceae bacterium]